MEFGVSQIPAADATVAPETARACLTPRVVLAVPLFNANSFWSLEDTCAIAKARTPSPPLGFLTLAALLPPEWELRLVNANTQVLTDDDLRWADLVMTGGMLPQAAGTAAIIERCNAIGVPVCVGGPDLTSRPEWYVERGADILVAGEAEGIIDEVVTAWQQGMRSGRFEAPKFQVDVTKSPVPRFDLITFSDYLWVSVQYSRGCPFNCEFCDIIELYGRVPRTKTNAQILAELDYLLTLGYFGHVDFCDDNLIGNKKALKKFLPDLIAWQKARGYPYRFSTEASMNLADDDELLAMLAEANFFLVFIGIESGDTETLVSMQKKQNTRRSLADSVQKVNGAGLLVVAGFIVGFDTEKNSVKADMVRLIEETSIPIGIVGLLTALPNTQLWRRLEREKRLHVDGLDGQDKGVVDFIDAARQKTGDQCTAGLNFETLRPRRDVLADYRGVLEKIYTPEAFFGRLNGVATYLRRPKLPIKPNPKLIRKNLGCFCLLGLALLRQPKVLWPFLRFFGSTLVKNPTAVEDLILLVAVYLHVGRFTKFVVKEIDDQIREIDAMELAAAPEIAAAA